MATVPPLQSLTSSYSPYTQSLLSAVQPSLFLTPVSSPHYVVHHAHIAQPSARVHSILPTLVWSATFTRFLLICMYISMVKLIELSGSFNTIPLGSLPPSHTSLPSLTRLSSSHPLTCLCLWLTQVQVSILPDPLVYGAAQVVSLTLPLGHLPVTGSISNALQDGKFSHL